MPLGTLLAMAGWTVSKWDTFGVMGYLKIGPCLLGWGTGFTTERASKPAEAGELTTSVFSRLLATTRFRRHLGYGFRSGLSVILAGSGSCAKFAQNRVKLVSLASGTRFVQLPTLVKRPAMGSGSRFGAFGLLGGCLGGVGFYE